MNLRSPYLYLTIVNFIVVFIVPSYEGVTPFLLATVAYLATTVGVYLYETWRSAKASDLAGLADRVVHQGQAVIFVGGMGVLTVVLLPLLVTEASLDALEQSLGVPLLFYGLFVFFVPILMLRGIVEGNGNKVEAEVWQQFRRRLLRPTGEEEAIKPSNLFTTYLVGRVQEAQDRQRQNSPPEVDASTGSEQNELTLTSYPTPDPDPDQTTKAEPPLPRSKNPLFGSEDELATDDPLEPVKEEVVGWFPELQPLVERRPVGLRPELLLDVLLKETFKDPEVYQYFVTDG